MARKAPHFRSSARPSLSWVSRCLPFLLNKHSPRMRLPSLLSLFAMLACAYAVSAATEPYSRSFNAYSELRTNAPSAAGELVYLLSYTSGSYKGGGMFIGRLTAATDDNGTIASGGAAWHWSRVIEDYESLNVLHFGAAHDGTTDDHDAVLSMWNWSRAQTGPLALNGIRVLEGNIMVSPIDISSYNVSDFAIYGPTTPYGVRPLVYFLSDKSRQPCFTVSAERVTLRGLGWNGQVDGTYDANRNPLTQTNYQGFFKNVWAGQSGQSIHVMGFQNTESGGHIFDVMNLYQSKFDQVYSSICYGDVWHIGWSGEDGTYWDHPRSVEISNVNLQYCLGDGGGIYARRMEQGTIRNVWIEHSRYPGDLSDGQWIIDALNIESTPYPMIMNNTRDITRQLSLQSGASVLRGTDGDGWLADEEKGWVRQEGYGILANAPVASLWDASMIRGTNSFNTSVWLNIGRVETQQAGGIWEFEVIAKAGNIAPNTSTVRPTNNGAPGITRIFIQRGPATQPIVTYTHEGTPGVTGVRFYGLNSNTYCILYVQLAPTVGEYGVFARSTGITRYDAGTWNYFRPSGDMSTTTPSGTTVAVPKSSLHNGEAGIGAEGSIVTIDTITVEPDTVNTTMIAGFMITKINGVDYAIPYYEAPADYPQDPPLGVPPYAEPPTGAASPTVKVPAVGLICTLLIAALAVLL